MGVVSILSWVHVSLVFLFFLLTLYSSSSHFFPYCGGLVSLANLICFGVFDVEGIYNQDYFIWLFIQIT